MYLERRCRVKYSGSGKPLPATVTLGPGMQEALGSLSSDCVELFPSGFLAAELSVLSSDTINSLVPPRGEAGSATAEAFQVNVSKDKVQQAGLV